MRILIAGIGGQGVILASKLLSLCALNGGLTVRTAETIGMAQRGGSVQSHIIIGEQTTLSPMIPRGQADIILAFDAGEADRAKVFAKPGCKIISAESLPPLKNKKTLNVAMIGAALRYLPFSEAEVLSALKSVIKAEYYEQNADALNIGGTAI